MHKLNWQRVEKLSCKIFNLKLTYLLISILILFQFFMVSIIFFGKYDSSEQVINKLSELENGISQVDEKLKAIESKQMFLQSQFYRLKQTENN